MMRKTTNTLDKVSGLRAEDWNLGCPDYEAPDHDIRIVESMG